MDELLKSQNTKKWRLLQSSLVLLIMILPAISASKARGNAESRIKNESKIRSISEEFDRPPSPDGHNTVAPQGPSTSSTYGAANDKEVTSILRSTSGSSLHVSRPGVKGVRSLETRDSGNPISVVEPEVVFVHQDATSEPPDRCQYILTINKSPQCPEVHASIAVLSDPSTVAVTQTQMNNYVIRLGNLENLVHSSSPATDDATPSRNSDDIHSGTEEAGKQQTHSKMKSIMEQMRDYMIELEAGFSESERQRVSLKKENENLIRTLQRSTVARRNLFAIKIDLEKNLHKEKEENMKLSAINITLTAQNQFLRKNKRNLESVRDSFRSRIRGLETEKTQMLAQIEGCRRQTEMLSNENDEIEIRVANLTGVLDKYTRTTEGAVQSDLEQERRNNEILTIRNSKLMEEVANATRQIKILLNKIPEVVEVPRNTEEDDPGTNFSIESVNKSSEIDEEDSSYCGNIISISGPETIRESRSFLERYGVWMKDPLQSMGGSKVWLIDTAKERVKELKQFGGLRKFMLNQPENTIMLPVPVESTGGVIYNGSFYYQRRNSRKLVRYDIRSKRVLKERPVHHAAFHGIYAYQWGGFTDIDLAVDEYGLWVIYSTRQNKGNIVISRLNPQTLRTWSTIKTPISKRAVANAFMACGILYTVDSYNAENASINYAFNPKTKRTRRISIPFVNRYRYNVMIDYNPRTRELFSWDNSHQVKYTVKFDKSFGKIQES